jgi:hypothetical protein
LGSQPSTSSGRIGWHLFRRNSQPRLGSRQPGEPSMLASREPWRRTCARFGELEGLVRAQRKRKLPVVLTPDEVKRLLSFLKGVDRLFLSLLYGSGMRLTERGPAPAGQRRRLCDPPPPDRIRHPDRPGAPRPQEHQDDDDLHARAQQRGRGVRSPHGRTLTAPSAYSTETLTFKPPYRGPSQVSNQVQFQWLTASRCKSP